MSQAGEAPGRGIYTCPICGEQVVLEDEDARLPQCPNCGGTEYVP